MEFRVYGWYKSDGEVVVDEYIVETDDFKTAFNAVMESETVQDFTRVTFLGISFGVDGVGSVHECLLTALHEAKSIGKGIDDIHPIKQMKINLN